MTQEEVKKLCQQKIARFKKLYEQRLGETALDKMLNWVMQLKDEMERMNAPEELIQTAIKETIANFLFIKKYCNSLTPQTLASDYLKRLTA